LLMLFLQPIKKFRFVHTEFLRNTHFMSAAQRLRINAARVKPIVSGSGR
jgi:hypothetical protein